MMHALRLHAIDRNFQAQVAAAAANAGGAGGGFDFVSFEGGAGQAQGVGVHLGLGLVVTARHVVGDEGSMVELDGGVRGAVIATTRSQLEDEFMAGRVAIVRFPAAMHMFPAAALQPPMVPLFGPLEPGHRVMLPSPGGLSRTITVQEAPIAPWYFLPDRLDVRDGDSGSGVWWEGPRGIELIGILQSRVRMRDTGHRHLMVAGPGLVREVFDRAVASLADP